MCVLGFSLFLFWFFNHYTAFTISLGGFVLLQSLMALMVSNFLGIPIWWRYIHLGFPLAIYGMFNLNLPPQVYLIGFLVTLSFYWTTFRTQVPFYPSPPVVWKHVSEIIPQSMPIRMVDIGSGLGDLTMYLAQQRFESYFLGIEIAPLPWILSLVRARLRDSKAKFVRADYNTLNFSEFDVVFAYLSPAAMPDLWEKAKSEMRQGSLLISYEFNIVQAPSAIDICVRDDLPLLYVWRM
jgi:SAM-dependent methyltransferase